MAHRRRHRWLGLALAAAAAWTLLPADARAERDDHRDRRHGHERHVRGGHGSDDVRFVRHDRERRHWRHHDRRHWRHDRHPRRHARHHDRHYRGHHDRHYRGHHDRRYWGRAHRYGHARHAWRHDRAYDRRHFTPRFRWSPRYGWILDF